MDRRKFLKFATSKLALSYAAAAASGAYFLYKRAEGNVLNDIQEKFSNGMEIPYSEFVTKAGNKEYSEVFVGDTQCIAKNAKGEKFNVNIPDDADIITLLRGSDAKIWIEENIAGKFVDLVRTFTPELLLLQTTLYARSQIQSHEQEKEFIRFRDSIDHEEYKSIAYHEAAHALVAVLKPGLLDVCKASIEPKENGSLGRVTMADPEKFRSATRKTLLNEVVTFMAGRAGEKFLNPDGDYSKGAFNDLERALQIIRTMVSQYGMSEKIGPINYGEIFYGARALWNRQFLTTEKLKEIEDEVTEIAKACEKDAEMFLKDHEQAYVALAEALLERKELQPEEIKAIISNSEQRAVVPQMLNE
ncbi:MAG: hypothetical protein WBK77_07305 [Alphaproteobacteria bacterium]